MTSINAVSTVNYPTSSVASRAMGPEQASLNTANVAPPAPGLEGPPPSREARNLNTVPVTEEQAGAQNQPQSPASQNPASQNLAPTLPFLETRTSAPDLRDNQNAAARSGANSFNDPNPSNLNAAPNSIPSGSSSAPDESDTAAMRDFNVNENVGRTIAELTQTYGNPTPNSSVDFYA